MTAPPARPTERRAEGEAAAPAGKERRIDRARTEFDADVPGPQRSATIPAVSRRREETLSRGFGQVATFSLRFLLVVAALVVLGYLVGRLWVVLLPILLALLLATVLWPAARFLRDHGVPAAVASLFVIALSLGALGGLVAVLAPQVTGQSQELANRVTAGLGALELKITGPPLNLGQDRIGLTVNSVVDELQNNAQMVAARVVSGAVAAGSLVLSGVLALVLCFFYLKDGPRFLPWLAGLLGPRAAPHVSIVAQRSWVTLSGFIRAQAAVGLIDAVFIGVGLAILGVPLALPLAVLVFFGAFVPIVGATVTGALAALVALVSNGLTSALIVVVLILVVQQIEGNIIHPMLVGRTLELHPALIILSVAAGGTAYGITGAFLAVPVVAVGSVVVRYVRQHLAELEPDPEAPLVSAGQPNEQVLEEVKTAREAGEQDDDDEPAEPATSVQT